MFQQYSGGIYSSKECNPNDLDHAILVVGYGGSGNESYWLIKNRYRDYNEKYRFNDKF